MTLEIVYIEPSSDLEPARKLVVSELSQERRHRKLIIRRGAQGGDPA
jgi:hypothetical protein